MLGGKSHFRSQILVHEHWTILGFCEILALNYAPRAAVPGAAAPGA